MRACHNSLKFTQTVLTFAEPRLDSLDAVLLVDSSYSTRPDAVFVGIKRVGKALALLTEKLGNLNILPNRAVGCCFSSLMLVGSCGPMTRSGFCSCSSFFGGRVGPIGRFTAGFTLLGICGPIVRCDPSLHFEKISKSLKIVLGVTSL